MPNAIVLVGCPAVGKTTLQNELVRRYPAEFSKAVTFTTRPMRQGEVDGVDYHFVDRDYFDAHADDFLETTEYGGNLYGSTLRCINDACKDGRTCVIVCDNNGCNAYHRNKDLDASIVFLKPSNKEMIIDRLKERDLPLDEMLSQASCIGDTPEHYDDVLEVSNTNLAYCVEYIYNL